MDDSLIQAIQNKVALTAISPSALRGTVSLWARMP